MFSDVFMAITPQEMHCILPKRVAYMACHFSPSGTGLSNLPCTLPTGSLLLIDDSMPVQGHDPDAVLHQINQMAETFSVKAVLLDFQRESSNEACEMVSAIAASCICPVVVTPSYSHIDNCGIFLPCPAVNMPLQVHLTPWLHKRIYLEIARDTVRYTVTEEGCQSQPYFQEIALPLSDEQLHCHYDVFVFPEKAEFTLSRTSADLASLSQEAYRMGVEGVVGLFQELQSA